MISLSDIGIKHITDMPSLTYVRHFLYKVYVEHLKWLPDTDNKSGIHIAIEGGFQVFTDDYDDVSDWYGAYIDDEIVGCFRASKRVEGQFELERYHYLPTFLKKDASLRELNRFAVHPQYENTPVIYVLFLRYIVDWASRNNVPLFSTTGMHNLTRVYNVVGIKTSDVASFRYAPSDPNLIKIVYAMPGNDMRNILRCCDTWLTKLSRLKLQMADKL